MDPRFGESLVDLAALADKVEEASGTSACPIVDGGILGDQGDLTGHRVVGDHADVTVGGFNVDRALVVPDPDTALLGLHSNRAQLRGSNAEINALKMLFGVITPSSDLERFTIKIATFQLNAIVKSLQGVLTEFTPQMAMG